VAIEAEWYRVVLMVASLRVNMMNLDKNVARLFAEATVPITPEQKLIPKIGRKSHRHYLQICVLAVLRAA
jgi:hypothetical protein